MCFVGYDGFQLKKDFQTSIQISFIYSITRLHSVMIIIQTYGHLATINKFQ